jgi:carbon storage regulator
MLVLSRKRNEQIVIGDTIVITVVDVRGDKVRLGIEAPQHVPVHRHEIYEELRSRQEVADTHAGETVDQP